MTLGQQDQLREIDRAGDGIGDEIQELIRRLTSGGVAGKSDDPRTVQAKRFWDIGVGRELTLESFQMYLATIPEIPEALKAKDKRFPILVLVELRIGLKRLCKLGDIAFGGDDQTFVAHDEGHAEFNQSTWIRIQNGRKNRNKKVTACRKGFNKSERGLTALQGVCAYLQNSVVVVEDVHAMDLPGSVLRGDRGRAALLEVWKGQMELFWRSGNDAFPRFGSASRRVY